MIDPGPRLAALRAQKPLTQCITNYVAMNIAANVLIAAGAAPAMVHARVEAAEFARLAAALSVNIGTLSAEWVEGMAEAAVAAREAGRPWVFDPVAVGATAARRAVGARLLALKPTVIRGNASEILALAGAGGAGRGVDAGDPVAAAEEAARALARASGAVVAVTGETDFVTDGQRALRVHGGSALMPQVTALGCALSALTASFCAVEPDPLVAAVSALAFYAAAGERGAVGAAGPGSFAVGFLDALAGLAPGDIGADRVRAA